MRQTWLRVAVVFVASALCSSVLQAFPAYESILLDTRPAYGATPAEQTRHGPALRDVCGTVGSVAPSLAAAAAAAAAAAVVQVLGSSPRNAPT